MKNEVFTREDIRRFINEHYIAISIDMDSRDNRDYRSESLSEREYARKMQVTTTPTMIFMGSDGTVLGRRLAESWFDEYDQWTPSGLESHWRENEEHLLMIRIFWKLWTYACRTFLPNG